MRIIQEKEEKTNASYGRISHSGYMLAREDIVRGGSSLGTPDRKTGTYGHHSSSSPRNHHYINHCNHPYRRMEYLPEDFKKVKPPTFNGELKNIEDSKAWLLGMKKFFKVHSYSEKMKDKIATFNIKGKAYIWWEYVKNVKGIWEEDLIWDNFERIFKKKYL